MKIILTAPCIQKPPCKYYSGKCHYEGVICIYFDWYEIDKYRYRLKRGSIIKDRLHEDYFDIIKH